MSYEDLDMGDKILGFCLVMISILGMMAIVICSLGLYEDMFIRPDRDDYAQNHCELKGFDTYERYSAKPLSKIPQGIKCKYADNRNKVVVD